MSLPKHVIFRVELAEILANAVALHIRIREYETDQQTHKTLAEYPIPDDIGIDYAEKHQHFESDLQSILDHLVSKYQETPLSTIECFYVPGDAKDVANYGQELIDWISDIRKDLIQLKAETTKMLRDKEKDSEIPRNSLLSDFLLYENRLKNVYHSVVKFECCLEIKYKPARPLLPLSNSRQVLVPQPQPRSPSATVLPETGRILRPKPNDSAVLTERLDRIRSTLTTFQTSRPEFSANLFQIHQKYRLESIQSPLSSRSSNAFYQALNNMTSGSLPQLLSTAKSGCQEVLNHNKQAFQIYLEQQLHASFELIQTVLGVTNAALISQVPEEGEIFE